MAFIEWVDLNAGDQAASEADTKNSKKAAKPSDGEDQNPAKK
jgi:hypothetical protein